MKRFLLNLLVVALVLFASGSVLLRAFFSNGAGWKSGGQVPVLAALALVFIVCVVASVWWAGARDLGQLTIGSVVALVLVTVVGMVAAPVAGMLAVANMKVLGRAGWPLTLALQYLAVSFVAVGCAAIGGQVGCKMSRPSNKRIEPTASGSIDQ